MTQIILLFFGFAVMTIPIWASIYYFNHKKVTTTKNGKHIPNFKHGRIFEFLFFLFVATFLSTAFYARSVNLLYTGLMIIAFTINGFACGMLHYIYGFHE